MRYFISFLFFGIFIPGFKAQDTIIIQSNPVTQEDYRFKTKIENYQKEDDGWTIWTFPIGKGKSSSELAPGTKWKYSVSQLSDNDLKTAWVEGDSLYGIGETIEFEINYPEHAFYGTAYQFYGVINLFNGYCKSITHWEENSRVKSLKVYYNDNFLCMVELKDTWHLQTFDIGQFFKYPYMSQNLDAPYSLKSGDKLKFEISAVFPGKKFKDTAISEFQMEGAKN